MFKAKCKYKNRVKYGKIKEIRFFQKGDDYVVIRFHKTSQGKIVTIDKLEERCWVNCTAPTEKEINFLMSDLGIEPELLRASLDMEESSHIDSEGKDILIIIDSPVVDKTGKNFTYYTNPVSIILTPENVVTISLKENSIIEEFAEGLIRSAYPERRMKFALQIMLRMSGKYLQYLNQIIKIMNHVEEILKKTMNNDELLQLLEIEKSLVYFSASLKSISGMLNKMSRGKCVRLEGEEADLLEDIVIEIKQAAEMSEIYLNILSSTMEAFSSIISNDLNVVAKKLASAAIIMTVPTIVSGIYGMNNPGIPGMEDWVIPFVAMIVGMAITWWVLKRKNMM